MKTRFKRRHTLFYIIGLIAIVGLACDIGGLNPANVQLGQPEDSEQQLFRGINYQRIVRQDPRLMVIHIVTIDLKADGLSSLVTPGDPDASRPLEAKTTSEFLEDHNLQIAINGDAFTPWFDLGPLGYSPQDGERVTPLGFAASRGTTYAQDTDEQPTLYLYQSNKASINGLDGRIFNAVSGYQLLIWNGDIVEGLNSNDLEPRTAVGLNRAGRQLVIVVIDGRQPGYSEGATLAELAQILKDQKAFSAMNMDGGGSSTLVMQGENGEPVVLNSPIHQGIPGNERPVGNHLGFSAR